MAYRDVLVNSFAMTYELVDCVDNAVKSIVAAFVKDDFPDGGYDIDGNDFVAKF